MLHKVDEVRSAHESSGTTCPDLPNSSGQFARHQLPGHPISIAETPIGLVQAFRDAMETLDDLHQGRPEAALLYKGKPVSVRYLIEVASIFVYERMPDDLYERLCAVCVVAGYGEEPKDHTFAAGAQCLRTIYTDLRAKRRATIETTRKAESQPVLTREVSHSRRRQLLDCYLKSPLRALASGL
jgi:hypothetical protein